MLPEAPRDHQDLTARFAWAIPPRFNIAAACCDAWADGSGRIALMHLGADGRLDVWSFDRLREASCRLANVLASRGVARGDRVGILLPQRPETAVAHLAAYRLGAIAVPLFVLFGPEALEYRLADSGAAAVVTDAEGVAKLAGLRARLPALATVLSVEGAGEAAEDAVRLMERAAAERTPADTSADDPALIIYTSGTTGPPKGALHAHRVLLGHLPGVELPHELFPRPGDLFWTPADWAWIGGLLDVLLPSLFHGVPVIAHRMAKFDPEAAFALMARHAVRNVFMPATALRMLRAATPPPGLALRSVASGGETLGEELLEWGRAAFGLTINEFYGQTECNLVVSNCAGLYPVRPGSMGRPVPGHEVAVIGPDGTPLPPGALGDIAIRRPDPVMFLGYWNDPEATARKFRGDWLVTGDQGTMDADGYLRFVGRDDDVITSAGYRIGPGEIEDCLNRHPAVLMSAAVGKPDALRTEIVKAFVVLRAGVAPSEALAREIQDFVRARLAAHEYPREIAFVDALPLTTTGKIIRRALREAERAVTEQSRTGRV
ncbi:AMP-binding protein [Elioraea sp. Yellowstone]|uniref:acyl-CoA synthetase n=1 Tax=Elioraea sp. Yellowstone TaxID=2592070 RepID=UPI001153BB49|nr:acyl-CoA synthetase [Elioraea sp. Yellowstone]TQF84163.1 AMP-binding protein [Elioraea sp. Yellowstone]